MLLSQFALGSDEELNPELLNFDGSDLKELLEPGLLGDHRVFRGTDNHTARMSKRIRLSGPGGSDDGSQWLLTQQLSKLPGFSTTKTSHDTDRFL